MWEDPDPESTVDKAQDFSKIEVKRLSQINTYFSIGELSSTPCLKVQSQKQRNQNTLSLAPSVTFSNTQVVRPSDMSYPLTDSILFVRFILKF